MLDPVRQGVLASQGLIWGVARPQAGSRVVFSIFQCGSVSGATAERTWLWGSHACCRNGDWVLLGGCGVQKTLGLSHAWKHFPFSFSCGFECVISPKGQKTAWPFFVCCSRCSSAPLVSVRKFSLLTQWPGRALELLLRGVSWRIWALWECIPPLSWGECFNRVVAHLRPLHWNRGSAFSKIKAGSLSSLPLVGACSSWGFSGDIYFQNI